MPNKFFKKGLVLGIIVLFVGLSVTSSNANFSNVNISTNDEMSSISMDNMGIIYVDDDNTEGPWDGTMAHPYQYIQDAVDEATDGDTVFVYSGTYSHHYPQNRGCVDIIKKNINLIGENKHTTIIDATNELGIIHVDAPKVSISGFTLQYSDNFGIELGFNYVQRITINDNILSGCKGEGAIVIWMGENRIYNNFISNSTTGVLIGGGNNNIYNNQITKNTEGIHIFENVLTGIDHNLISLNKYGIVIENCRIKIRFNNFIQNLNQATFSNYLLVPLGRNKWLYNYWDDWEKTIPRPIKGEWAFYLFIFKDIIFIGPFPSYEYDLYPASKPNPCEIPDTSFIYGCGIE